MSNSTVINGCFVINSKNLLNEDSFYKVGCVFNHVNGEELVESAVLYKTRKSYYLRFLSTHNKCYQVITISLGNKLAARQVAGLMSEDEDSIDVLFCIKYQIKMGTSKENYRFTAEIYPNIKSLYYQDTFEKSWGETGFKAVQFDVDIFIKDCSELVAIKLPENVFAQKQTKVAKVSRITFANHLNEEITNEEEVV